MWLPAASGLFCNNFFRTLYMASDSSGGASATLPPAPAQDSAPTAAPGQKDATAPSSSGRITALTAERDSYRDGLAEATRRISALQECQRTDRELVAANMERVLEEKARLLEEIEVITAQKDTITEALVVANRQLGERQLLRDPAAEGSEEVALWKAEHARLKESWLLQREHLEAALSAQRKATDEATAAQHEASAAHGRLQKAEQKAEETIAQHAAMRLELDRLRLALEREQESSRASEHRFNAASHRANAQSLEAKVNRLESVVHLEALAVEMVQIEKGWTRGEDRVWAYAFAQRRHLAEHLSMCASLRSCEEEAASAVDTECTDVRLRMATAVEELERCRGAVEETERELECVRQSKMALGSERDALAAELASERRLAVSLKQELRKHLGKRAALGAGETQTAPEVEPS